MKSKGIDGILIETHNWGSTVAFWRDLGYELEFAERPRRAPFENSTGLPADIARRSRRTAYRR
jgi:hypothetical protein